MIIPIDDPDDPRIAPFRAVRERDVAGRAGGFIAEGEVVLNVLARSPRHRAASLLIAVERIGRLTALVEAFPPETPVYSAEQRVMDAIVGFPIHRGVLAHGERATNATAEALLASAPAEAVLLALFGVANHDNMGGLFRNAAAFGAHAVLLDPTCCDPLYRKAIRVSAGAALTVPFAPLPAGSDGLDVLERHGFRPFSLSPRGETALADLERPPRAAILLGTEGSGLPPRLLEATRTVAIPMARGVDSLNLATASGVALHHLAFVARRAELGGGALDDAQQQKDDDDHQDEAEAAAGKIAPRPAVTPGRQGADQEQDKNDDQDGAEHEVLRNGA